MNKGELIDKIAKDAKISKVQAGNALNSTIDGVVASLMAIHRLVSFADPIKKKRILGAVL